jgi:hypothetical protein
LGSEEESQERALRSGDTTESDVIDGRKIRDAEGERLKGEGTARVGDGLMALYLCIYTVSPI